MRVLVTGAAASLCWSAVVSQGDIVFEYDGRAVLVVDEEAQAVLCDQVLYLDAIGRELELAQQPLSSATREPGGSSARASRPAQQSQVAHGAVSDPSGMIWLRGRLEEEEESDAIYH